MTSFLLPSLSFIYVFVMRIEVATGAKVGHGTKGKIEKSLRGLRLYGCLWSARKEPKQILRPGQTPGRTHWA